jgi:plasmid stabilization system protein ParE
MKDQQLRLSLAAERDLDDLFDYIATESGATRAQAVLRRIGATLESLAAMPAIGRVRGDLDGGPRSFTTWPWVIIYDALIDGRGILVWRILDGRRDLANLV